MQQTVYPKRIIACIGVEKPENLLLRQPLQMDLIENRLTVCHPGSHIILDYGKEMRGGIRLLTFGSDLSPVRIRFGESVGECCAELGVGEEFSGKPQEREISPQARRQNATNDHALRDISLTLPNWSDTPVGDTGFRFVRLDFAGEYTVKSVPCYNTILSRRTVYQYQGDREIEKIFAAAKRTVDLCAGSGYLWDGIKRDRLVWAGDLGPEVLAMTALYGRTAEAENSLEFVKVPLPEWMNYQPTYSMWWIVTLRDYFRRTQAEGFVKKQLPYLEGLVEQLAQGVDENGAMHHTTSYFLDWPHAETPEVLEGVRAINIMAAKAAVELLAHFGRSTEAAQLLLTRLMRQEIHPTSKLVAALKYLAVGEITPWEKSLLLSGGIKGMSTFMGYYILTAIHAFSPETAASVLKEYYGGMLKLGATTFWEDFEPEQAEGTPIHILPQEGRPDCHGDYGKHCYVGYRRSLCHGWSAGVIAYIKECE